MFRNRAGQKLTLLAFDATTNLPKAADAANITAYVSKDDGTLTILSDTTATEIDPTNARGLYNFDLTQSETDADKLVFTGKSSTANIVVASSVLYTHPQLIRPPAGQIVSATPTSFVVSGLAGVTGQYPGRRLYVTLFAGGDLYTDPSLTNVVSGGNHTFTFASAQKVTPAPGDAIMVLGI